MEKRRFWLSIGSNKQQEKTGILSYDHTFYYYPLESIILSDSLANPIIEFGEIQI